MHRFRTVLFDADDTLIAGTPDYVGLYVVCAREMGVELARRDVLKALFATWTDQSAGRPNAPLAAPHGASYERAVQEEVSIYAAAGAGDKARAIAEHFLARSTSRDIFRPYPEVPGVLEALRAQGLRLGLLTNRTWRVREFLGEIGLAGYLDAVVACGELGVHKPDPRIFHHALGALSATAADTLYVGDSQLFDIVGARKAGMAVVWVNRRREKLREGVPAPDYEMPDLTGLPALLGAAIR